MKKTDWSRDEKCKIKKEREGERKKKRERQIWSERGGGREKEGVSLSLKTLKTHFLCFQRTYYIFELVLSLVFENNSIKQVFKA